MPTPTKERPVKDWHTDVANALAPIRDALRTRDRSQLWLGEQIGQTPQVIHYYLSGKRFPPADMVRAMCAALDIPTVRLPRTPDFSRAGHKGAQTRRASRAARIRDGPDPPASVSRSHPQQRSIRSTRRPRTKGADSA